MIALVPKGSNVRDAAGPPPWLPSALIYALQTYNKKGASRRREHQNGSVTAVNGHTSSFSSLEHSVKPRKQRKD